MVLARLNALMPARSGFGHTDVMGAGEHAAQTGEFCAYRARRIVEVVQIEVLAIMFEGTIGLEDALVRKIDAAEKHGRYLIKLLG